MKTPLNSNPSLQTLDPTFGKRGLPMACELIPVTLELIEIAPPSFVLVLFEGLTPF
jgi:hypothetical protein